MNVVKEIERITLAELEKGIPLHASWHSEYKNSNYVFVGNLDYQLTEGDVICIFSQFGQVEDCVLIRDKETGKSKGYGFVSYKQWESTVLAVENFNGTTILGRVIRCDHTKDYKPPKVDPKDDEFKEERKKRKREEKREKKERKKEKKKTKKEKKEDSFVKKENNE